MRWSICWLMVRSAAELRWGLGLAGGEQRDKDAVVDLGVENGERQAVGGQVVGLSSHRGDGSRPGTRWNGARRQGKCMGQTARFQETLRRLAMIDEGFVEDEAGLGLGHIGDRRG